MMCDERLRAEAEHTGGFFWVQRGDNLITVQVAGRMVYFPCLWRRDPMPVSSLPASGWKMIERVANPVTEVAF